MSGEHLGTARTQLVTLTAGTVRCGLPVDAVLEVHPMVAVTALPDAPAEVEGVVDAHGEVVGVVDLRRWLGQPVEPVRAEDRLLLVQTARRRLALHGGPDVELAEAPVDELSDALRTEEERILGAARLDDGLVLLVDLERFLGEAAGEHLDRAIDALLGGEAPRSRP